MHNAYSKTTTLLAASFLMVSTAITRADNSLPAANPISTIATFGAPRIEEDGKLCILPQTNPANPLGSIALALEDGATASIDIEITNPEKIDAIVNVSNKLTLDRNDMFFAYDSESLYVARTHLTKETQHMPIAFLEKQLAASEDKHRAEIASLRPENFLMRCLAIKGAAT